jgi:hypothetical protein
MAHDLGKLADLAIELAGAFATVMVSPARDVGSACFWGPGSAHRLDWSPRIGLRDGRARLTVGFWVPA